MELMIDRRHIQSAPHRQRRRSAKSRQRYVAFPPFVIANFFAAVGLAFHHRGMAVGLRFVIDYMTA
jgi:hypothetical protein